MADGRNTLEAQVLTPEGEVFSGELKPVAGFASQGSVLPAKDSRGLPVVSVNVPEVDVEFLRVREKDLPTFSSKRTSLSKSWVPTSGRENSSASDRPSLFWSG